MGSEVGSEFVTDATSQDQEGLHTQAACQAALACKQDTQYLKMPSAF